MTAISTFRFHIQLAEGLFIKGYNGRIVHGAFLQFIRDYDEDLSTYLHENRGRRPYTLTELSFRKMDSHWVAFFDLNTIDDELISRMVKILMDDREHEIFLIDQFCTIFKIEYQKTNIPDPELLSIGTRIWINFESPTVFSDSKKNAQTDPYPHLNTIWGQLIKNYSLLVDEISDQDQALFIRYALDQLATPKFNIKSKHLTLGHKIKVTGFEGSILFMIEDNTHLELLKPILILAEIWGIGGKTTMGFGSLSINIYKPERKKSGQKSQVKQLQTSKEVN